MNFLSYFQLHLYLKDQLTNSTRVPGTSHQWTRTSGDITTRKANWSNEPKDQIHMDWNLMIWLSSRITSRLDRSIWCSDCHGTHGICYSRYDVYYFVKTWVRTLNHLLKLPSRYTKTVPNGSRILRLCFGDLNL